MGDIIFVFNIVVALWEGNFCHIGGSYLGARAVIEAVKSSNYNLLAKDTPQILFIGNSISPAKLNETVKLCEGKDICVNVISKSGTTTEPAIAFRVFYTRINKVDEFLCLSCAFVANNKFNHFYFLLYR